ncbi:hypothetical protein MML48_4g00001878 [Holotrichia oblita]|uniref:Uncharacterized protein n=1 Tax=Holotrichia oblita TaxID=644536 RepID=A0ACB9T7R6_HOLOL|nr:hypothetical protein MML48_4g00001878 [Holotrichia oblita]
MNKELEVVEYPDDSEIVRSVMEQEQTKEFTILNESDEEIGPETNVVGDSFPTVQKALEALQTVGMVTMVATSAYLPSVKFWRAIERDVEKVILDLDHQFLLLLLVTKQMLHKQISVVVWIAGILAAIGVAILGVFCLLSIIQLAMLTSKEKVVLKYSIVVILKLAIGLLATLLAIAAAGLFALQTDEQNTSGFNITRGPGFYIQILLIVLNAVLFVMALYDVFFSRRPGGDPTQATEPPVGETISNPGFRDRPQRTAEISMTDASGKPYLPSTTTTNGSMNSVNTTSTTLGSNGSSFTLPKAPARSSLKKKPADGLGIQNPGFSGSSPTFSRNGSMKKVRIQTHSTDV